MTNKPETAAAAPNKPPVAVLTGPRTALIGTPITVDGSGSYDQDRGGKIKSWEYDFLNGVVIAGGGSPGAVTLQDGYEDEGDHIIILTVWDGPNQTGAKDTAQHLILIEAEVVEPPPPPLVLHVPSGVAVESASGPRPVTFTVTVEGGQAPVTVTVNPPSGSIFQLGRTTVRVDAYSIDGQEQHAEFLVEVIDTSVEIPPLSLILPANMTVESSDGQPRPVTFDIQTTGGQAPITITADPPSGTLFPVGPHAVQVAAQSADGQVQAGVFTVTVVSTVPALSLQLPAPVTLVSANGEPVVATYAATTTGGAPPVTLTYHPPSGSSFPVGTTAVSVTARSSDGQTQTGTFEVIVNAAAPGQLVLDVPVFRSALAPDATGVTVNLHAIVTGGVQPVTVTATAPGVTLAFYSAEPIVGGKFPLGATVVTVRATDATGAVAESTCTVSVEQQAIMPPSANAHADFDARRALPSCFAAWSLRDPAELAKVVKGDRLQTVYDAAAQAMRIGLPNRIVVDGVHTGVLKSIPNQVWIPIKTTEIGQTVIVADWKPGPLWNYDLGRLDGHKHLNIRKTTDSIWIEPNTIIPAGKPTRLSRVRRYGTIGPPPQTIPGPFKVTNPDGTVESYDTDSIGPVQQNVYVAGEKWVRYLFILDQRADGWCEVSYWVWIQGDPQKLCILDKVLFACATTNRPHHFDYEMNSSSQRARDAAPQVQASVPYIWSYGRDVTLHRGVEDPLALLREPID